MSVYDSESVCLVTKVKKAGNRGKVISLQDYPTLMSTWYFMFSVIMKKEAANYNGPF